MSISMELKDCTIRHVDLSRDRQVEASTSPLFVVFWWNALPLGAKLYLPVELPMDWAHLQPLAAELTSLQLAARLQDLGGPARATHDGRPLLLVRPEALKQSADLLEQLDRVSAPADTLCGDLTVVVCTRDRPEVLPQCLARLQAQSCPPGAIIVVDNSEGRTAEAAVAGFAGVKYVHEPRPGLSIARNAGIRASRTDLIAFTDDDAEPAPSWTAELCRAFAATAADCVTGLVLPARLDTIAKRFFQFEMEGFGHRFLPLVYDHRFFAETCPAGAQVWRVGAGANMAFRRKVFDRIGGFDQRLGAGASGCSEDSELWYRLLAGGGTCQFEPRAVVMHHHREDWAGLRRQMRAYGRGHVSALFVQSDRFRHRGNLHRIFVQLPRYFVLTTFQALRDGDRRRLQILSDEVRGWLSGLTYGLRPRWRRQSRQSPLAPLSTPAGS